jgi:rhamnogalacturonan hydrolase
MASILSTLVTAAALLAGVSAQLSTTVGPTTSLSAKQAKICSVLDYGGAVGSSDIGPAILSAFTVCCLPRFMRCSVDVLSRTAC